MTSDITVNEKISKLTLCIQQDENMGYEIKDSIKSKWKSHIFVECCSHFYK